MLTSLKSLEAVDVTNLKAIAGGIGEIVSEIEGVTEKKAEALAKVMQASNASSRISAATAPSTVGGGGFNFLGNLGGGSASEKIFHIVLNVDGRQFGEVTKKVVGQTLNAAIGD